jgi:uncharacterized ferritin-like protein (DUF455 family)
MKPAYETLADYSIAVIKQTVPAQKVRLARQAGKFWFARKIPATHSSRPSRIPELPGRPARPELFSPHDMPRRRMGSKKGMIALVHSLAHIELNAIDMTFDLIARFCDAPLPQAFLDGAVKIGIEEADHFEMINDRLEELGAAYGDLPAHGELWEAICKTRHDLLARLAIVPLVLEARGLDVSLTMIAKVKAAGEPTIAKTMDTIYNDEITHVAFGAKWFKYLCDQQEIDPRSKFQSLVRTYFHGTIKPPFNTKARSLAGLTPDFYLTLVNDRTL